MFGEVDLEGSIAGHISCASTLGGGDKDFLNGFSLASINERRTMGDRERMVATGRLGSGFSGGLLLGRGRGMPLCNLGGAVYSPCRLSLA